MRTCRPGTLTFDRYHVIAKLNDAVDQVRRAEQKDKPALKKTRYVWLKNRANLTVKQGRRWPG